MYLKNVADRFDKAGSLCANDVEKNQVTASKNVPVTDFGDVGNNSLLKENPHARLIALEGCCSSEASQLLNDRKCLAIVNRKFIFLSGSR